MIEFPESDDGVAELLAMREVLRPLVLKLLLDSDKASQHINISIDDIFNSLIESVTSTAIQMLVFARKREGHKADFVEAEILMYIAAQWQLSQRVLEHHLGVIYNDVSYFDKSTQDMAILRSSMADEALEGLIRTRKEILRASEGLSHET